MRLPYPRFTVRRLLIAVAVVGLLMGAGRCVVVMRTRSAAYRERAYEFGFMTTRVYGKGVQAKDGAYVNAYDNENNYLRYVWAREMANKYWQLADRPWLPVEPDLPPPEPLAHPRSAVDCPAELRSRGPWCRWLVEPVYPWWTFLWTCRHGPLTGYEPRWSFP
jgi:hypothetical protein